MKIDPLLLATILLSLFGIVANNFRRKQSF